MKVDPAKLAADQEEELAFLRQEMAEHELATEVVPVTPSNDWPVYDDLDPDEWRERDDRDDYDDTFWE